MMTVEYVLSKRPVLRITITLFFSLVVVGGKYAETTFLQSYVYLLRCLCDVFYVFTTTSVTFGQPTSSSLVAAACNAKQDISRMFYFSTTFLIISNKRDLRNILC